MKSILANIKQIDGFSSYLNLAYAVKGKGFSKLTIRRAFNRCVDKGDYDKNGKQEILNHLYHFSNTQYPKK